MNTCFSEMCIEKNVVCEPCGPDVAAGYDPPTKQVRELQEVDVS